MSKAGTKSRGCPTCASDEGGRAMNRQPTQLCLKPGVTLTRQDGQIGLAHNGHTRLARDALQTEIIRQLTRSTPTPESVSQYLCTLQRPPGCDLDASLTLASFILDFSDYLET